MMLFELEWNRVEFSGLAKPPVTNYKESNMITFKTPFFCHGHAGIPVTPAAPTGKLNTI